MCVASLMVVAVVLTSSTVALSPCPCYEDADSVICDNTSVSIIPDCVPENIKVLSIRTSSIALVPRNILNFTGLRKLSIQYFKYPKLTKTFLSGQRHLPNFQISSTSLEYVDKDWFKYSSRIYTLVLSDNKIRSLAPETFHYLGKLETVYLNGNPLATLPPSLFLPTSLKTVYLHDNRWHCDSDMVSLMKWVSSYRAIVQLPSYCAYPVELEGLNLEYLNSN